MSEESLKKIFVLDVSGFIFRAYFALPEMKSPSGESTQAIFGFIRSVNKLIKEYSPHYMVGVFDGPDNKQSRREIYSDYKSNRVDRGEDLYKQIPIVKSYCDLIGLSYLEESGVEADDVIASVTKQALSKGYEVCICTADKDLLQLVQPHVVAINPWKDQPPLTEKEVQEAYGILPSQIADYLALVGDSSDNIPGVAGCGPKTATSLLQKYDSVESILEHVGELKGATQKRIIEQQEVLRMSKELAVLNSDISLDREIEDMKFPFNSPSLEELNAFYIQNGFRTLVQSSATPQSLSIEIQVIETCEQLSNAFSALQGKSVAFSVAYSGDFLTSLEVLGIAFSSEESGVYYVDLSTTTEDLITPLQQFFAREDTQFYGYNVKRDMHALQNKGIAVQCSLDLAIAEHLLSGGAKTSYQTLLLNHGFSAGAGRFKRDWGSLSLPIEKRPENPSQFFGEFVAYLPKIKESLFSSLKEKGIEEWFFEVEMPLEKVLFDMERKGMPLDTLKLQELEGILSDELEDLTNEIYKLVGIPFNIKSPKQLSDILYNYLGLRSVDKAKSTKAEVLEALIEDHPVIEKLLTFRSIEKLLSTYVRALPKQVDPTTSRIHPTFNQIGTATGRLACQDPNLQNIPIRSKRGLLLRQTFCDPRPDWFLLSADYSQVELRFLAHFSGDESLQLAFNSGEDVFRFTASQVFQVPLDEVTKEQREKAKIVNFGLIYGQQAYGLSKILKISFTEAEDLIEDYFARYPKVENFIQDTIKEASQNLRVTTLKGRERIIENWSGFSSRDKGASGRLAVNTRIQGSAAELIKLAMIQIAEQIKKRGLRSRLLLQIHDELVFEVPEEEREEMQTLVRDIMESAMILSVPLVVNILIGKNWAEC